MTRKHLFVVLAICLAISFSGASIAGAASVTMVEDPWPPYTLGKEGDVPTQGHAVEFTKHIFNKINTPVEMQLLPWKRCLALVEKGEKDGLMLLSYKKDREAWMVFTDPIMYSNDLVWYNVNKPFEWNTLEDMKGKKIGRTRGFSYGDEFNAAEKQYGFTVEEALNDEQNLKKLAAGRIDIFICNEIAALYIFNQNPDLKAKIKAATKPSKSVSLHMGFSKKSGMASRLPEVNKVIADMIGDGTVDKILGR